MMFNLVAFTAVTKASGDNCVDDAWCQDRHGPNFFCEKRRCGDGSCVERRVVPEDADWNSNSWNDDGWNANGWGRRLDADTKSADELPEPEQRRLGMDRRCRRDWECDSGLECGPRGRCLRSDDELCQRDSECASNYCRTGVCEPDSATARNGGGGFGRRRAEEDLDVAGEVTLDEAQAPEFRRSGWCRDKWDCAANEYCNAWGWCRAGTPDGSLADSGKNPECSGHKYGPCPTPGQHCQYQRGSYSCVWTGRRLEESSDDEVTLEELAAPEFRRLVGGWCRNKWDCAANEECANVSFGWGKCRAGTPDGSRADSGKNPECSGDKYGPCSGGKFCQFQHASGSYKCVF